MNTESAALTSFEISSRFRKTIEQRIERLELDAVWDENMLELLTNEDHLRRHRRLVAVQRAEALRMRLFLDRSRTRMPRPLIGL
jgi:hypothetical protein